MIAPAPAAPDIRVLVSDRDPAVLHLLEQVLRRSGYRVVSAPEPLEVARALDPAATDIVILQVGGALDLRPLQALRTNVALAHLRVLAVLPPEEDDRVADALEEGADDCMVKPLSPRELLARILAMARRIERPATVLSFDGLTIDLRSRAVQVGSELVLLPPREFDLLAYLALHPNEVITRDRLLAQVWGASATWQLGETLTEHVHRLRRRIEHEPSDPRWLRTVRGVGYLFDTTADAAAGD